MIPARILPAALLLLIASTAQAVPVTIYATGRVSQSYYARDDNAHTYDFVIGERVYLSLTYDFDGTPLPPGSNVKIAGGITSDLGFSGGFSGSSLSRTTGNESGGMLTLHFAGDSRSVDLTIGGIGESGHLRYTRDGGVGHEGFEADVIRVADRDAFAMPEPSTFAMGVVGVTLAGLGWLRRRATATG